MIETRNDYLFDSLGRYCPERFVAPAAPRAEITFDDDLTAEQCEAADRIVAWLATHPGLHNRSTVARRAAKADYTTTATALAWLERNRMITADGKGCWRKFGAR